MKIFKLLTIAVLLLLPGISVSGSTPSADEILRQVDDHRLLSDNFVMTIRVESYLNNHLEGLTVMNGEINNGNMTVITFLEPVKMKGRKILINEQDLQLIIPNVKNPVHITASQRLAGGISYGDIAGVRYDQGYKAKLTGEEAMAGMKPDGTKASVDQCLVLELTALSTRTNYHKIVIWVDQQNLLPVKADFFALSGKKMTTVYYTAPKKVNGTTIITKMFLFDQIKTTRHFALEYLDFKTANTNN